MRRSLVWSLALVLASCQSVPTATPPEPTGAIAVIAGNAIAFQARGTDVSDRLFEDFLTSGNLKKTYGDRADELVAQLRKTRDAVAAARKASAASHGSRLASPYVPAGEFSTTLFGLTFAIVLDAMTKSSGTRESKPNPYTSTENGPTMMTTTTLNVTDVFSSSGSRVTYTMHWTYRSVAKDNALGATLHDSTDDRTIVGTIDVCPDAGGSVNASLDSSAQLSSTKDGTRGATTSSAFVGTVDDSAALRTVRQTFRDETKWQSPSGDGGYDASMSTSYGAAQSGSFLGGMQAGGFSGSYTTTGNGADSVSKASAWSLVLDAYALDSPYQEAQKLWRNGRCVMVQAPDYDAQTPIDVKDQDKSQHDEAVDRSSEKKFQANLKHRFGGTLTASVTAALTSGGKTLEPNKLDAVPGSLTYKAPDEEDKKATVKLQSTSKRGIGTLVLDFHTGNESLTLTIAGTVTGSQGGFGASSDVSHSVTIGPLEFKKAAEDVWIAMGTFTSQVRSELVGPGASIVCTGSETGPLQIVMRTETRGDQRVWVLDRRNSIAATGQGSVQCASPNGTTTNQSDGSSGGLFLSSLGDLVIPPDGGSIPVRGQSTSPFGGRFQAEGTATAITKKK